MRPGSRRRLLTGLAGITLKEHGPLAAIGLLALALRVWGVAYGLPYDLTADEPHQIVQALRIGVGEGGPLVRMWHTIGKGGLDYILFAEYGLLFVVMWAGGLVAGPREFGLQYLLDPTAFYLVGRVTVAVLGAATCLAAYAAGRRMYGRRVGLGAAFIGAAAYYHVADSHTINVHVPMACALWTGIVAYLRFDENGRRRWLLVSGLLCGAAIALAYTAAAGLLIVGADFVWRRWKTAGLAGLVRQGGVLLGGALASIALMSPDLLTGAGLLLSNFSQILGGAPTAGGDAGGVRGAIDSVTILRTQDWTGYLRVLSLPNNIALSVAALAGAAAGLWRRERWTPILAGVSALFVLVLSASNRGLSEPYLFPVAPALWLLGSRGVEALAASRRALFAVGVALVTAVPLFHVIRDDYMLMQPDTRIVAKEWIERHVPSGARILMDGMRFRFVQGAPLTPSNAAVERRLADLESSELTLSRETLAMYREAALRMPAPRYDLYSTMYGLDVQGLDYYARSCFDYVVISSFNEKRYDSADAQARYPHAAAFYRDIRRDPRFEPVFTVGPAMWERVGPTLTVYKVRCSPAGAGATP